MGKTSLLAPGFGFHPTDVELVMYYLKRKVMGKRLHFEAIAEVDLYKFGPWDLPDKSLLKGGDLKWYFFCPVEKKYSSGARMNRATEFGYWKTSGKDRPVHYNEELVGLIKTLIFHRGKAPRGDRTDWVMHEYRLEDKNLAERGAVQNTYVLCMIFQKEGMGPRNGAQYGAPFKEEDWNDDEQVDCVETVPSADLFTPNYVLPTNRISSVAIGTSILGGTDSESCLSETMRTHFEGLTPVCSSDVVYQASGDGDILPVVLANSDDDILPLLASFTENNPLISIEDNILPEVLANSDDDILLLLASFTEDNTLISIEDDKNKDLCHGNAEPELYSGVDNFHNDLGDVGNMSRPTEDGYSYFDSQEVHLNHHFKTTDLRQPVDVFLNFC